MPHKRVLCIGLLCPHTFCVTWRGVSARSQPTATAPGSHGSLQHRGLPDATGDTEHGGTALEVVFSVLLCCEGCSLLRV